MSTNHHNPIVAGAALNVASVNTPLGALDSAISGIIAGVTPNRFTLVPDAAPTYNNITKTLTVNGAYVTLPDTEYMTNPIKDIAGVPLYGVVIIETQSKPAFFHLLWKTGNYSMSPVSPFSEITLIKIGESPNRWNVLSVTSNNKSSPAYSRNYVDLTPVSLRGGSSAGIGVNVTGITGSGTIATGSGVGEQGWDPHSLVTTGAVIGNTAGVVTNNYSQFTADAVKKITGTGSRNTNTTGRLWLGLFSAVPGTTDNPPPSHSLGITVFNNQFRSVFANGSSWESNVLGSLVADTCTNWQWGAEFESNVRGYVWQATHLGDYACNASNLLPSPSIGLGLAQLLVTTTALAVSARIHRLTAWI